MGIPHLMQNLQTYGEKVLFQQQDGTKLSAPTTNIIIDGPALAYHIYYICLSRRGGARNALDAIPSYKELAYAIIAWLDQLETYSIGM